MMLRRRYIVRSNFYPWDLALFWTRRGAERYTMGRRMCGDATAKVVERW